MTGYDFIFILIILLMVSLSMFIRHMEKTWYAPSAIFSLLWTFIVSFSILSAPDYYFSAGALLFIVFSIILFFIGGRMYELFHNQNSREQKNLSFPMKTRLDLLITIGIMTGVFSIFFLLRDAGLFFSDIFDIGKIKEASFRLSVERYEGVRLSSLTMLCLTVSYAASFAAGMILSQKPETREKIKILLLIAPVVLFTMIYTARAVLLYMLAIIAGSYFAFRPYADKKPLKLFSKTNLAVAFAGSLVLLAIFIISQASRMKLNLADNNQLAMLTNYLKVWFSGNVSGLSAWFDFPDMKAADKTVSYTFAGLAEWLGAPPRIVGIYEMTLDANHKMEFSNIYTLFRFFIDDFGISGTCIVFFILGFISKKLFTGSLNGRSTDASILSGLLALLLFSFISSIFAYNSVLFAWILFVCLIYYNENILKNAAFHTSADHHR